MDVPQPHLASSDLWCLDGVCDAAFVYAPEVENKRTAGLHTIDGLIEFYKREYPERTQRVRSALGGHSIQKQEKRGWTMNLPGANSAYIDMDKLRLRIVAHTARLQRNRGFPQ